MRTRFRFIAALLAITVIAAVFSVYADGTKAATTTAATSTTTTTKTTTTTTTETKKPLKPVANAPCNTAAGVQECCSAANCSGKVLSNRDKHNCKVKSHGKSWHNAAGTCSNRL